MNCLLDRSLPEKFIDNIRNIVVEAGFVPVNIAARSLGRGEHISVSIGQDCDLSGRTIVKNQQKLTGLILEAFPTAQVDVCTVEC